MDQMLIIFTTFTSDNTTSSLAVNLINTMNFTPQDLVHCLQVTSGAIPDDNQDQDQTREIYLLVEEDNDLIEKLWTGNEINRPGICRVGREEGFAGGVFVEWGEGETAPSIQIYTYVCVYADLFSFCEEMHLLRRYQQHPQMLQV